MHLLSGEPMHDLSGVDSCYGVARQREGSRQNSIGGSGVLSLRHFGLVLFIPWRVGAEAAGAANDGFGAATLSGRSQLRHDPIATAG